MGRCEEGVDVNVEAEFLVPEGVANRAGEGSVVEVGVWSVGKEVPQFTGLCVDEKLEEDGDRVLPCSEFEHVGDVRDELFDGFRAVTEPDGGELVAHFAVQLLDEGERKGLDVGKVELGFGGAVGAGGWEPVIELCGGDGDMVEAGG